MILRTGCTLVFVLAWVAQIAAQDGRDTCFRALIQADTISLDSIRLDPSSIILTPALDHQISEDGKTITILEEFADSLTVCYRKFAIQQGQKFFNKSRELYFEDATQRAEASSMESASLAPIMSESLFETDNIDKMGAISRSVSFGNTQDVFVNSALNLQLQGALTDNINIEAVIADQNVPFQPDGNTQQIRDFDNVYIKLYNDDFSLLAGDVVLENRDDYFLRYYKNVQGGRFDINYDVAEGEGETSIAASVAKGQFASIQIEAIEGVQGPYRLRGPNGERFVIIMANSEKVFLDGKQLFRGFDRDYVIDYNQAEIVFNPGVLITQFSRIRVDFEYADQNYSRSILAASHKQTWDKFQFKTEIYREKDNPNQPLAFSLSDDDKRKLSEAGNDATFAAIEGLDSVGFSMDRILYAKVDTILENTSIEIFQFSVDPTTAIYAVTFSEVGFGLGNYVLAETALNGRVFEWVAPIDGFPQGNFEPIIQVPTPNLKQLWNNELQFNIDDHQSVYTDIAISNRDRNLFATDQDEDDQGFAIRSGYRISNKPLADGVYKFSADVNYEYDSRSFQAIDRFRYIEFDRDWSFTAIDSVQFLDEKILTAEVRVEKDLQDHFRYKFSRRERTQLFDGTQHVLDVGKAFGRLRHQSDLFFLSSSQGQVDSEWQRWKADTYWQTSSIIPGYIYEVDRNQVAIAENDSVIGTAMNFQENRWYIRTNDSLKHQVRLDYAVREDQLPVGGELLPQTSSRTLALSGKSRISGRQRMDYKLTYRNLDYLLDPDAADDETLMGRVDWSGNLLDNSISTELTYALANSRELRKEFIFIRVNNGEGTHTWRDDNQDGIQDLTEFYLAVNSDERNYAKIFIPTDEYITAFNNILNYRLGLNAPSQWRRQGGLKGVLGHLSNTTSLSKDRKLTADDLATRLNPFASNIDDEDLISLRSNVRTTFFVNRGNPKFGLEFGWSDQSSKVLLTNGFEARNKETWVASGRYNMKREVTFQLQYESGLKGNSSEVQANRNYLIDYLELSPQIVWLPSNNFRLSTKYSIVDNSNIQLENEGERSTIHRIQVEMRWAKAIERSISALFKVSDIDFEGQENSPIGYELLEALRPGTNFNWNVQWQQKLLNGLQMSLSYEGRKSQEQNTVHIGRMQVTALF